MKVLALLVSLPAPDRPPSSCATTVTMAVPGRPDGVKLSVPSGATAGRSLNSTSPKVTSTSNDTCWPLSSAGPALMSVAQPESTCGPALAGTDWLGPAVKLGGSFTGATVSRTATGPEDSGAVAGPVGESVLAREIRGRGVAESAVCRELELAVGGRRVGEGLERAAVRIRVVAEHTARLHLQRADPP